MVTIPQSLNRWGVPFLITYAVLIAFLFHHSIQGTLHLEMNRMIVLSVVIYLFSHLLRIIRFWILLADRQCTFLKISIVHLCGATIGFFTKVLWGEVAKVGLYGLLCNPSLTRISIAILLTRIMDLTVIFGVLFYFWTTGAFFESRFFFAAGILIIIAAVILLLLNRTLDFLIEFFIRHLQGSLLPAIIGGLNSVKKHNRDLKTNRPELLWILFLLTILIWGIEFFGVFLFFKYSLGMTVSNSWKGVLDHVGSKAFGIAGGIATPATELYGIYFFIVGLFSVLILLYKVVSSLKGRKP